MPWLHDFTQLLICSRKRTKQPIDALSAASEIHQRAWIAINVTCVLNFASSLYARPRLSMFAFAVLATEIIVYFMGVFLSWRRFVVGVTLTPIKLDHVSQTAGVHSSAQPSVALTTPPPQGRPHI